MQELIFPDSFYQNRSSPVKRRRGSSCHWFRDALTKREIQAYAFKMGQKRRFATDTRGSNSWVIQLLQPPFHMSSFFWLGRGRSSFTFLRVSNSGCGKVFRCRRCAPCFWEQLQNRDTMKDSRHFGFPISTNLFVAACGRSTFLGSQRATNSFASCSRVYETHHDTPM